MCTGWTFDQVGEQFDLPRLKAMQSYWEGNPPTHIMIARYLGIKPKEAPKPDNDGLEAALAAFTQG
jgi:hypothetical protein